MPNDPIDPSILRERIRVGAIVRSLREWRDLRQEGLEHLSGVSYRQIRRIENGSINVGLDSYIRLAHSLRVPLDWLFTEDWPARIDDPAGGGAGSGETPPTATP